MITNIILIVLIAIVFYLILKSVKDRFQNELCSHKYSKNDKNECVNECNNLKEPACTPEECTKRCIKSVVCNNKDYESCNFNKCNWSVDRETCEVPKDTYFSTDEESISFTKNLKNVNIDRKQDSKVINPTKFKSTLTMMRLNGINSFIHIPDFYSKNTMISFFFDFRENTKLNSVPLISTNFWQVNLEKDVSSGGFLLVISSSNSGNIAFPRVKYPLKIIAGNLYSFGLIINSENKTATVIVYDLINEKSDINDKGLKIENFVYSETPSILIGSNVSRNLFLDGRLADIKITREISNLVTLKRNTFLFSDEDLFALSKGRVIKVDEVDKNELPGKINFVGKKVNTHFILYWSKPEQGASSIMYYIIILRDKTNNKNYTLLKRSENCEECSYKLTTLEYDTDYEVGVTTINNKGLQDEIDYIKLRLESSSGAANNDGINNEFIFTNDKVKNKVSCNPDGTFTIGKNCDELATERISSNLNTQDYRNILEKISKQRVLDASVDFKISL